MTLKKHVPEVLLVLVGILAGILFLGWRPGAKVGIILPAPAGAGTTGSLEGYVTDSVTGKGVYGAQVKVDLGNSNFVAVSTVSAGYYLFKDNLPQGKGYKLLVAKANYSSWKGNCPEIKSGRRARKDVVLSAGQGTGVLTGTVRDGSTPIPGVHLVISTYSLVSDQQGNYFIRLAKGTNHSLRATAPGYQPFSASGIAVKATQTTTYNVNLTRLPVAAAEWKNRTVSAEGLRIELDFIDHTPGQRELSIITINQVKITAEGLVKLEVGRESGLPPLVLENPKSGEFYPVNLACLWPAYAPGRGIYVKVLVKDKEFKWYPFKGGAEGELNGRKPDLEGEEKVYKQGEKVCTGTN